MDILNTSSEIIELWFTKAITAANLKADDLRGTNALKNAFSVFFFGIGVSATVTSGIIYVTTGELFLAQIFSVLTLSVSSVLFAIDLFFVMRLARVGVALRHVVGAVLFCFAAAIPVLTVLMVEQFYTAIEVFREQGDPSSNYLSGATIRLLFPVEPASLFARIRVLVLLALELCVAIYFVGVHLRRLLVELSFPHAPVRVPIALLLSIGLHVFVVVPYLSRAHWILIDTVLR